MVSYNFSTGRTVKYNSRCCSIFRHRKVEDQPAYLLRDIFNGEVLDNVLETEIVDCPHSDIVNHYWDQFVYDGDNGKAANFIVNSIIKNLGNATNLSWGPSEDGNSYKFVLSGQTWTKEKTE